MTVKISSEKIAEGIKVSLEKAEEHLTGAEVLIENKNINNAVVLVEFTIEEFGRAVALREKLQERTEDVETDLFTFKRYKNGKFEMTFKSEKDCKKFYDTYLDMDMIYNENRNEYDGWLR